MLINKPMESHQVIAVYVIIHKITEKKEIWGKAQRESARRCKSDWEKIQGAGAEIPLVAKSHGLNSNANAWLRPVNLE